MSPTGELAWDGTHTGSEVWAVYSLELQEAPRGAWPLCPTEQVFLVLSTWPRSLANLTALFRVTDSSPQ